MAKYRHDLPQMKGGTFLSDGGMETTLIFHHGVELPQFASFVLLDTEEGRRHLKAYYETYLKIARQRGLGFVLDTATWRASLDWGRVLGYTPERLREVNIASIAMLEELRAKWEAPATPCIINGVIGPRGDGYKAGNMDAMEAEDYHAFQVEIFSATAADMISAITMNTIPEAVGIACAAKAAEMPCVIAFTVETDGRLARGQSLRQAIELVDEKSDGYPLYFMINCAHPTHFEQALKSGEKWLDRVHGIRANASTRSHQELDESTTLDAGDIADLSRRYRDLTRSFPAMRVLGGCCGTDHRHIAAICEAVTGPQALSA
jgi:homocysteine S-methyltransferase